MRFILMVSRAMMKVSLKVNNPMKKTHHLEQMGKVNLLLRLGKASLKETGDRLVRRPLPQLGVTRSSSSLLLKPRQRQL